MSEIEEIPEVAYHLSEHTYHFDENGNLCVPNPSAYWIPEITFTAEIDGTVYTVDGSYEGTETFVKKLERLIEKNALEAWNEEDDT